MRIYPAYVVALALLLTTALLIPAAALADLRGSASPWRGRVLVSLGEASYAVFLVHLTVLTVGMQFLGREHPYPPLAVLLLALGFLVLPYALAFALHRWVEVPVLRQSPGARVHRRTATRVDRAGDPVEGPLTRPG
jgi:peptidoglycan/LPS O-acetylase OafA/YrhL